MRRLQPILEAGAAKHRPVLCGLEWHGGLGAALRTGRPRLGANPGAAIGALGLALLTVLGVVGELLIVEEQLLSGGEYKLSAATDTLQYSIREFHGRFPQDRETRRYRP